jgi:hypothetical protein
MSFNLNTAVGDIGSALAKAAATPGAPASVVKALDSLQTAVADIEAAIPDLAQALAIDGINMALTKVGLGVMEPEIDALAGPAVSAVEGLIASKLGIAALAPSAPAAEAAPSNATVQGDVVHGLDAGTV